MGLFFFGRSDPSVSSLGEEKPLKNDLGAKQAHAESEGDAQLRKFIRELPLEPHFRMVQPHPTVDSSRKSWTAPGLILISPDLPTIFYLTTAWLWSGRTGELIQQLAGSSAVHQAARFFDRMAINPKDAQNVSEIEDLRNV